MLRRIRNSALPVVLILAGHAAIAQALCDHPRVDCPDPITVMGCEEEGAYVTYPEPTGMDDCGPLPVFLESGLPSGSLFPFGTSTVVWRTPSDEDGFHGSCQFEVRVLRPNITIDRPNDVYVRSCDGQPVIVDYPIPTASSECGPVPMFLERGRDSGDLFPVDINIVEWRTPYDEDGDYESVIFRVVVEVAEVTLNCPTGDIQVSGCPDGAIVDYPMPTAENECGPRPVYKLDGQAPGERFPLGTTPVVWAHRYENTQEGYRSCGFTVTVLPDDEPPVLTCPDQVVAAATPGQGSAVVTFDVTATDNCSGPVAITCVPPSGSTFPCGTTAVECTARDATGNESSCKFEVTVALPVALDIRPGACPNPFKIGENGVLPVAILGSSLFDIDEIDPATVRLEGVGALRGTREDVGAPFVPWLGRSDCMDCNKLKRDGIADLTFKFSAPAVAEALGPVEDRECRVVRLTATTLDGCPVVGEDVVRIQGGNQVVEALVESPEVESAPAILTPRLGAARPNPLARSTDIEFELPRPARAQLVIHDVVGRRVRTLVDGVEGAGTHRRTWDGRDDLGQPVSNGVYFSVLTVEGDAARRQVRKLIVSR